MEDHLGQMLPERFLAVVHSLLEIFDYGTENFVVDRADFLDNVVLEVLRRFGVVSVDLVFEIPPKKKIQGRQVAGPRWPVYALREMTRSPNFVFRRSSVSVAVWQVAPSC